MGGAVTPLSTKKTERENFSKKISFDKTYLETYFIYILKTLF